MISAKKRAILYAVLAVVLVSVLAVGVPAAVSAYSPKPDFTVVIDAGHGGIDGGVRGIRTGICERELNLAVAEKLADYFVTAGINVAMTRKTKAGLYDAGTTSNFKRKDMEKRAEIINNANPAVVVSIHMNYFSSSVRRGAQIFFNKASEPSEILARTLQEVINRTINLKYAGRECIPLSADLFILQCSDAPTVIAECGFLSNPLDEKLLINEAYQIELAYQIFSGLMSYLLTQ